MALVYNDILTLDTEALSFMYCVESSGEGREGLYDLVVDGISSGGFPVSIITAPKGQVITLVEKMRDYWNDEDARMEIPEPRRMTIEEMDEAFSLVERIDDVSFHVYTISKTKFLVVKDMTRKLFNRKEGETRLDLAKRVGKYLLDNMRQFLDEQQRDEIVRKLESDDIKTRSVGDFIDEELDNINMVRKNDIDPNDLSDEELDNLIDDIKSE